MPAVRRNVEQDQVNKSHIPMSAFVVRMCDDDDDVADTKLNK